LLPSRRPFGVLGLLLYSVLGLASARYAAAQDPGGLAAFFEGKQVVVKMDMPGTQQGVDIYPQRPQPLDLKSYSGRVKKFGVAIRNGDSVMITKIKVKDNNIEFQLAGGGYGTFGDDTDTSAHFTPADKSSREKDLENRLKTETDPDRRRSLQRELDRVRSDRQRRDDFARAAAENAAESKKARIDGKRIQGGSRFNLHFDSRNLGDSLTPQLVMTALAQYVAFPPEAFPPSVEPSPAVTSASKPPEPAVGPDSAKQLKKGQTTEQVESLLGQPAETHKRSENGLEITSLSFQGKDVIIRADFVNGVLVQYSMSSR
jgi:hypothetical protein